jgi:hypothetical protein
MTVLFILPLSFSVLNMRFPLEILALSERASLTYLITFHSNLKGSDYSCFTLTL